MVMRAFGFAFLFSFIFKLAYVQAAVPNLQKDIQFRDLVCKSLVTQRHFFKYENRYFSIDADPTQFMKVLDLDRRDLKNILCGGSFVFAKVKQLNLAPIELLPLRHDGNLIFFYEIQYEKAFRDVLFPKGIRFTLVAYDSENDEPDEESDSEIQFSLTNRFVMAISSADSRVRNGIPELGKLSIVLERIRKNLLDDQKKLSQTQRESNDAELLNFSVIWDHFKKSSREEFLKLGQDFSIQSKVPLDLLTNELVQYLLVLEVKNRTSPQAFQERPLLSFVKVLHFLEEKRFANKKSATDLDQESDSESSGEEVDPTSIAAVRFCKEVGGEVHAYKMGTRNGSSEVARLCAFGEAEIGVETLFKFYSTGKQSLAIQHFLNDAEAVKLRETQKNDPYPELRVSTTVDEKGGFVHQLVPSTEGTKPSPFDGSALSSKEKLGSSSSTSNAPEFSRIIGSFLINPNSNNKDLLVKGFCKGLGGVSTRLFRLPEMTQKFARGCVFLEDQSGIDSRTLFNGSEHEGSAKLKSVLLKIESGGLF